MELESISYSLTSVSFDLKLSSLHDSKCCILVVRVNFFYFSPTVTQIRHTKGENSYPICWVYYRTIAMKINGLFPKLDLQLEKKIKNTTNKNKSNTEIYKITLATTRSGV